MKFHKDFGVARAVGQRCEAAFTDRLRQRGLEAVRDSRVDFHPGLPAILFAGPAFNLVFAVLAYTLMFMHGVPGIKPVVGVVQAESVAASAGLREGDTIVSVGGQPVLTWESATLGILDELLAKWEGEWDHSFVPLFRDHAY